MSTDSLVDTAEAVSTGLAIGYIEESHMSSSTDTDCPGHPSLPATAVEPSYFDAAKASIASTAP